MRDKPKQRSMTFTGCWTCKSRKVKCDQRPGTCKNCEKRGITCGGYDIKLQWLADPFADPAMSGGKGRRKIMLDQSGGSRYTIQEIDAFLLAIDDQDKENPYLRKGPFSTFKTRTEVSEHQDQSETQSAHIPLAIDLVESQLVGDPVENTHLPDNVLITVEPTELDLTSDLSLSQIENDNSDGHINDMVEDAGYEEIVDNQSAVPDAGLVDISSDYISLAIGRETGLEDSTMILQDASLILSGGTNLRIEQIQTSFSGDPDLDTLMHHYIFNVADVLQPIKHPQNTYRDLYVPTALEGAVTSLSDPRPIERKAHSALYHALLSSAAFHLWNCNNSQTKFQKLGTLHRYYALQNLQAAIEAPNLGADYRSLLMAMLGVLTIGVISGEGDDFIIHLHGTLQLRNSRRHWRMISGLTRQLNDISAFLTLIARTTSFDQPPSLSMSYDTYMPFTDDFMSEGNQSSSCFGYMYGITTNVAAAIQETCRLAEVLSWFDINPGQLSIPDQVLEDCEALGERLVSWSIEFEKGSFQIGLDTMKEIFNYHAKAWHCAALIYYYRRIQNFATADLMREVQCVAEYMHAVEDVKERSKKNLSTKMAPITWPMFIASCDTVRSNREVCREWWVRVQHYGIQNLKKQWDVVQRIWEMGDEMEEQGIGVKNWIEIYRKLGVNVFPV